MNNKVIIVPGLGNDTKKIRWATKYWKDYGLDVILFSVGWETNESFDDKLERLIKLIDGLSKDCNPVSLVGISAGGSLVLNAFLKKRKDVLKVVSICARLRKGSVSGFRSFESRTSSSSSFRNSILSFGQKENLLTEKDRKRIMTITARFGDELVSYDTAIILGALNLQVPTIEHVFSIGFALRYSKPIRNFLAS